MYGKYSEVSSSGPYPFAEWRPLILEKKQPRKIFVQCNTRIDGNSSFSSLIKTGTSSVFINFC